MFATLRLALYGFTSGGVFVAVVLPEGPARFALGLVAAYLLGGLALLAGGAATLAELLALVLPSDPSDDVTK